MGDYEERGLLPLHLEDDGLQPGNDVQVALASRVAVAQLVQLARGVFLGETGLYLRGGNGPRDYSMPKTSHKRQRE